MKAQGFEGGSEGAAVTTTTTGTGGDAMAIAAQPTSGNVWLHTAAAKVSGSMGARRVLDTTNGYMRWDEEATSGRAVVGRWVTVPSAPTGDALVHSLRSTADGFMSGLILRSSLRFAALHGGSTIFFGDTQMSPAVTAGAKYYVQSAVTKDNGTAGTGRVEFAVWNTSGTKLFEWDSGVGAITVNTGSVNPGVYRIGGVTTTNSGWTNDDVDDVQVGNLASGWFAVPLPAAAPVANAGADIVLEAGKAFTRDGLDTDTDGDVVTREWLVDGQVVATGARLTGRAAVGLRTSSKVYEYRVTDSGGRVGSDFLTVTSLAVTRRFGNPLKAALRRVFTTTATPPVLEPIATLDPATMTTGAQSSLVWATATLTQTNAANQPVKAVNGAGIPYLGFDGTDFLRQGSNTSSVVRNRTGLTFYAVVDVDAAASGFRYIYGNANSDSTGNIWLGIRLIDGVLNIAGRTRDTDTLATVPGTRDLRGGIHQIIVSMDYVGARVRAWVDGSVEIDEPWQTASAGPTSDAASRAVSVGIHANGTTSPMWLGRMYALDVYDGVHTEAERAEVVSNLPAPVADPPPPPPDPVASGTINAYVSEARQFYPDGTGEWAHMPPASEWPVIYSLPDDGIPFTPPPEHSGALVIRGHRIRGNTTSVINYTSQFTGSNGASASQCARVICPRKFTDPQPYNEIDLWRGVIVQGWHFKADGWGATPLPYALHKTKEEADAGTNGITTPREGLWYYNPNRPINGAAAGGQIDAPGGTGTRQHERPLYLRATGHDSGKTFFALEAPRGEGPFVVEGLNVNGTAAGGNTRVVISGERMGEASVYYRKSSSGSYGGKVPGGDNLFQVYGHIADFIAIGCSGVSHLQSIFLQHGEHYPLGHADYTPTTRKKIVLRKITVKGCENPAHNRSAGMQFWPSELSGDPRNGGSMPDYWDIQDVYVWQAGRGTIAQSEMFPEVKSLDAPEYVTEAMAQAEGGIAYAANPLPFS